jgi:Tfp pilus assembly protein PilN
MQTRYPINLSTEPFRRDRALLLATSALAALLALGLVLLVSLILSERQRASDTRASLAAVEAETRAQAAEIAKYDAILRETQNAEVLDRNLFLNQLITRKSVSWTQLFSDLEKVMPGGVRLVSIRPQILADNRIILDMTIGARTEEAAVRMLMRLEGSPLFGATTVQSSIPPGQNEPTYRYRLSVNYAPQL